MRPLIGTSWKMNMTSSEADRWFRAFLPAVAELDDRDLFVLPPFTAIWVARELLRDTQVAWGAQDVAPLDAGAHTGDVSAPMLADLGCRYVEVGHSERRRDHGETPELIGSKAAAALRWGMQPIICVGEHERGDLANTMPFLLDDLGRCLAKVAAEDLASVVIAYEPEWAIGEGAIAAPPGLPSAPAAPASRSSTAAASTSPAPRGCWRNPGSAASSSAVMLSIR